MALSSSNRRIVKCLNSAVVVFESSTGGLVEFQLSTVEKVEFSSATRSSNRRMVE